MVWVKKVIIFYRVFRWTKSYRLTRQWYRYEFIPSLGFTAEEAVKKDMADAVLDYLDTIALGGYA